MNILNLVSETNGNSILGKEPSLQNSQIDFKGKNNILYCENDVKLVNSKIVFNGNNSLIYLSNNKNDYKFNISINNNQACFFGKNNYINGVINIILSEQKHLFVGTDNLFSFGIWIRNADPHLIYDIQTKKRINDTKSIFIGDHVWLGQSSIILKGTQIGSGSIVGAMGLVSETVIPSNECWGGVSARRIKEGVFWEGSCVHSWTNAETNKNAKYEKDTYIFKTNIDNSTCFDEIDTRLSWAETAIDKLNYLIEFATVDERNRFAIN